MFHPPQASFLMKNAPWSWRKLLLAEREGFAALPAATLDGSGHFVTSARDRPQDGRALSGSNPSTLLPASFLMKKAPSLGPRLYWRRGRDSNPRDLAARRFSRPLHSTTLPPLQCTYHHSAIPRLCAMLLLMQFSVYSLRKGRQVGILTLCSECEHKGVREFKEAPCPT